MLCDWKGRSLLKFTSVLRGIVNGFRFSRTTPLVFGSFYISFSGSGSCSIIVGVFETKEFNVNFKSLHNQIVIFLEEVTNPGNLGSIIRTADWFGVKNIICSNGSVDLYNPKVVQSSMGSLSRMSVSYVDLEEFILNVRKHNIFSLAADLNGEDIYSQKKTHIQEIKDSLE